MMNLITERLVTKNGRDVRIRVDYSPGQFHVSISVDNLLVSDNTSIANYLTEDEIYPNITDEKNIKRINEKLIEVNKLISDSFSKDAS